MLAAVRYRRGQAVVILVLSALVTAGAAFAPLYTRALQQAVVATLLDQAPVARAGVRIASTSASEPYLALFPARLADLVPAQVRAASGPAVASHAVGVRRMPLDAQPGGLLLWRDGMCAHVGFTAGACPQAAGEVAISADQAAAFGQAVGSRIAVGEWDGSVAKVEAAPHTEVRVTGVYSPRDTDPYWFGDRLTGQAASRAGFDVMLTPEATLTGAVSAPGGSGSADWVQPQYGLDVPLIPGRVDIDRIAPLGSAVASFVQYPLGVQYAGSHQSDAVTVTSGLPAIAAEVATGRDQAAVTVPLLMAQLVLLLACVLWLVLLAAADQRRGEVAVARLRGRGAAGARRLLLAETLPALILGAPLGLGLAFALTAVARRVVLSPTPPAELPAGAVYAALLALAATLTLALLSVRRVSRAPIADLLRSVSAHRAGIRLGLLEAMLVAAAGAAFAALVTGSVRGPVGQVAPTLLAVAIGVLAARLLPALLSAAGRWLVLRRGRPGSGAALLQASRRSSTRWLVPIVTVALCLVVVAGDALAVGARNRLGRAQAEVGAASVVTVGTADLAALVAAVRSVDPTGAHLTPVVRISPTGTDTVTTVGVDPAAFPRIALWPGRAPAAGAWAKLPGPPIAPLRLTGSRLTYHVQMTSLQASGADAGAIPQSLALGLRVVRADGTTEVLPLGTLPSEGIDADQHASLACASGCRVAGIGVLAPPSAAAVRGVVTLSRLAVDAAPVALGDASAWRAPTGGDTAAQGSIRDDALTIDFANGGRTETFLAHASMPAVVASLTTPAAAPSAAGATFGGAFVNGDDLLLTSAGQLPLLPGAPPKSAAVNLAVLLTQGWRGRGSAVASVYADSADPAVLAPLTRALGAAGIGIVSVEHPGRVAAAYGRTAAAWSLDLSLAVAVLALVVAAVGLLVLVAASARARERDYAGLAMAGVGRRAIAAIAVLEILPVILLCGLIGVAAGLWSAPAALDLVPLFPSPPPTYVVDLGTAWLPSLAAAGAALAVLLIVGAVASLRVARAARLSRLREVA